MRANKSAALGSSVHIVVRPRENADGSLRTDAIGDWRAVLRELPARMHHWMPRLAKEGVVGADAIFACLDAARKIAQGLGAHLEDLGRVVEIRGDQARLLSVAERTRHLFGKDQAQRAPARRAKKVKQITLFEELEAAEKDAGWGDVGLPPAGETTLDRVHQAMVLFAAGRGEALKRFLIEEGVGRAASF